MNAGPRSFCDIARSPSPVTGADLLAHYGAPVSLDSYRGLSAVRPLVKRIGCTSTIELPPSNGLGWAGTGL